MSTKAFAPTAVQLRGFVAVADHLGFRPAAASLGLSQPALSQALSTLEEGLGLRLVDRSTRVVTLTEAGRRVLPQARAVLASLDAFVGAAADAAEPLSGPLRIGVIPTAAPYLLPRLLPALARELPDSDVRIVEDQTARLIEGVRSATVDAAIMALPSGAPDLADRELYTEAFSLLVPAEHPLAGRTDLTTTHLGELPLLLLDEGHCLRDQTLELCGGDRPAPLPGGDTRATSLATVLRCVAGGLGVTLVPDSAVADETRDPALAVARFAAPRPGRTMGLVTRAGAAAAGDYDRLAEVIRASADGICG